MSRDRLRASLLEALLRLEPEGRACEAACPHVARLFEDTGPVCVLQIDGAGALRAGTESERGFAEHAARCLASEDLPDGDGPFARAALEGLPFAEVLAARLGTRREPLAMLVVGAPPLAEAERTERLARLAEVALALGAACSRAQRVQALLQQSALDRAHRDEADRARAQAELLLQVVHASVEAVSVDEVVARVIPLATRATRARRGAFWVTDPEGEVLRTYKGYGVGTLERSVHEAASGTRVDAHAFGRRLLASGRPFVARVTPESIGSPIEEALSHFALGALLFVPVRAKERFLGAIVLDYADEDDIAPGDPRLLEGVAAQAALALENAMAFEEIHRQERALDRLNARLLERQEEERRRVCFELHDGIGQRLSAAKLAIDHLRRGAHEAQLGSISELLGGVIDEIRSLGTDLRPTHLDHLGLAAAVRWFARTCAARSALDVEVEVDDPLPLLEPGVTTSLYRVTQEALDNACRHGGARRAVIQLGIDDDRFVLSVADDGAGFDPKLASPGDEGSPCLGLLTIRERAHALGGELAIVSRPGGGTTVRLAVPLDRACAG